MASSPSLVVVARGRHAGGAIVDQLDLAERAEIEVAPHRRLSAVGEPDLQVGLAVGRGRVERHLAGVARLDRRRAQHVGRPEVEVGFGHRQLADRIGRPVYQQETGLLRRHLASGERKGDGQQSTHHEMGFSGGCIASYRRFGGPLKVEVGSMTSFARTAQALAIATLIAAMQPVRPAEAQTDDSRRSGGSFYAGAHVGFMFGTANATLSDPIGISSQSATNPYGALFGGVQAGWEYVFPSRLMLGIEADFSFPNYEDASKVLSYRATSSGYASEEYEFVASLRGRLGYDIGAWTPYLTGGIAWLSNRYSRIDLTTGNEDANPGNIRLGYTVGAGIDYRLDSRWSTRAEYLYTNFNLSGFVFGSAPARYDTQYDLHRVRFGLNYRFGEVEEKSTRNDRGPGSFEVHGQTVFVYQGYPPINAPYDGVNSLPAVGQSRETWATSGFLGVRLWEGGEFYYNPELLQGYGVALSAGAGGFPNGEAQRAFPYPRYSTSRLFLRQTFGLGGEREKVESDLGQLSGERDISRITVQAGKFAVQDVFDNNAY